MKLLEIKIESSYDVEDALAYFATEDLKALGTEARRRSDFEQAGWLHDSTVVDMDDIPNLPDELEFIAYFDEETDPEETVKCFKDKLAELAGYGLKTAPGEISVDYVADQDWNTVWQKYYHVINLSRHLAIVPEWEDYQPAFKDQEIIRLDPGLAFGTGNHQTTQLAMLGIERAMVKPLTVADVGTGSGILAIAAHKLGAKSVLATDISDESMKAAKENAALNGIHDIALQKTSLLAGVDGKFDLIVANILAEILLDLIPQLDSHLNEDGQVIFSGIDYLQLPKIEQALAENGFQINLKMRAGRWIGLAISRKHD
jgi:ribosomal protein L11 methyltransferase